MPHLPLPSPILFVIVLAVIWNIGVLLLFGLDKRAAMRGFRRVPERHLIVAIVLFGAIGAWLGQRHFRHKTRKSPFNWLIPLMTPIQTGGFAAAIWGMSV
jgi:uncharacterized membrane protein YsdA (DUF1294 family)